jgi:hypothetical protein
MFLAFSRPSSGAQWLQWQPLVLPSYRGDSPAMFMVGPAGFTFVSWWKSCCVRGRAGRFYIRIVVRVVLCPWSGRPVLPSYRGDSRAVFVVGPSGSTTNTAVRWCTDLQTLNLKNDQNLNRTRSFFGVRKSFVTTQWKAVRLRSLLCNAARIQSKKCNFAFVRWGWQMAHLVQCQPPHSLMSKFFHGQRVILYKSNDDVTFLTTYSLLKIDIASTWSCFGRAVCGHFVPTQRSC